MVNLVIQSGTYWTGKRCLFGHSSNTYSLGPLGVGTTLTRDKLNLSLIILNAVMVMLCLK